MKIVNLNKDPSRIDIFNEALSVFPNTMLAERLEMASLISYEFLGNIELEERSDEWMLRASLHAATGNEDAIKHIKEVQELHKITKQLKLKKIKNKQELVLINIHRTMVVEYRKAYHEYNIKRLKELKITELADFSKEEFWQLEVPQYDSNDNNENPYIQKLTTIIKEKEYIFAFDFQVEQEFTYTEFAATNALTSDFIKIPLWKFPMMTDMEFFQLKYTREDLKKPLLAFHTQFNECVKAMSELSFTADNCEKILHLFKQKIMPFQQPMQQAINDSLYCSQQRNKTEKDSGMTFNLGITSAENLIHYFERLEIVEPYIASEIKDRLGKEINLQSSCIFSYCTIEQADKERK